MPKNLFAAITKADAATRTVSGIAMQEVVDRENECCDYTKSKPYFLAWSANQEKASGGKSKGNVREMHTPSAVGKLTELTCDDAQKAFVVVAHIVDDAAWKKVEEGVYTGFSIGANFAEKSVVKDGVFWWVADPVEVSLVDLPCVPTATFEMKLADGTVERRKFSPAVATKVAGSRAKSMYTVSEMASSLSNIRYMLEELDWEAEYENDDSQIPQRLRDWLAEGATIFLDLAEEETSEFAAMITAQKAAQAVNTKGSGCGCDCSGCANCTKKKVLQPQPSTKEKAMTPEQTKAFNEAAEQMKAAAAGMTAATEKMTAVAGDVATIKTDLAEVKTQGAGFDTRLKAIEEGNQTFKDFLEVFSEQPAAAKTVHPAVAVTREADTGKGANPSADLPAEGADLTSKPDERRKGLKAIYHGAEAAASE